MAALTLTILVHSTVTQAVDESASAVIKDTNGETVGIASFTQAPAGVLLKLSLTRMPPGEHAFHIHALADSSTAWVTVLCTSIALRRPSWVG